MILNTTSMTLKASLATTVAATQPVIVVDYKVWQIDGQPSRPGTFTTTMSNTTAVIILPAPPVGQAYQPVNVSAYNGDTTTATLNVQKVSGSATYKMVQQDLLAGESLHWTEAAGWYFL